MGRDLPEYPTLFSKFADTLIGANDDIVKPPETEAFDWECELAVVIGAPVRRARGEDAERAIAGFAVLNDITCRDWQFRTREWLQGKNWEATTPLGPYLVTPDELPGGVRPALEISTKIDGETVQKDTTGDLLFDPVALVEYVSTMVTLRPGDVHRHGYARRRRPRPQAAALPPAGTGGHHGDRGPRRVPQHLRGRGVSQAAVLGRAA